MDTAFLIKLIGALFAIMNPFVNLPVFLSMTDGMARAAQRKTALATVGFSAAMCALIVIAGSRILGFFGISVADFRVAGGLVLMMIALGMLNGNNSTAHHGTASEKAHQAEATSIAFYPLTFPMIVGPGTITTIIIFSGQAQGAAGFGMIALALAGILLSLGVVLYFASAIGQYMSQTLRVIMIRLMGMILAAIAVDMIATGLKTLLPGLG